MVSEVSFPTFWGVLRSIKVVSVIGSAVSEISRFARFYEKRANRPIFYLFVVTQNEMIHIMHLTPAPVNLISVYTPSRPR